MTRRQCLSCERLAKPGESFCCRECELAYEHARERAPGRETVELQTENGAHVWRAGRRLNLQNSA